MFSFPKPNVQAGNFFFNRTPTTRHHPSINKDAAGKRKREDESDSDVVDSEVAFTKHIHFLLKCPLRDLERKDLHERLGLKKGASQEKIKKAYYKLSLKVHPDKNPDDPTAAARFSLLDRAYKILSDDELKQEHYKDGDAMRGSEHFHYYRSNGAPSTTTFTSLFETMYGTRLKSEDTRKQARAKKRANMQCPPHVMHLELTLEDLALGCKKRIKFKRRVTSPLDGVVAKDVEEVINVPRGAQHDQRLVYEGRGDHYGGMKKGDLHVIFKELKHDFFQRRGANITCVLDNNLADAVFGGTFKVRTLGGVIKIDAPGPLLGNQTFTLKGHGAYKSVNSDERGLFSVFFRLKKPKRPVCTERNSEAEHVVRDALNSMYDHGDSVSDVDGRHNA